MDAFGGLRGKVYALALNRQRNIPRPSTMAAECRTSPRHNKNAFRSFGQGDHMAIKGHKTH